VVYSLDMLTSHPSFYSARYPGLMAFCLYSIPIIFFMYFFAHLHDIPRTVGVDTITKDDYMNGIYQRIWIT
jgi:hypothetical protein